MRSCHEGDEGAYARDDSFPRDYADEVSNFDFGPSPAPAPGPPPPGAQNVPSQHFGSSDGAQSDPQQPGRTPEPSQPSDTTSGGRIAPIGLIALLVLLLVVLGVAWTGNRFYPMNSRIDSAWRHLPGPAGELSSYLRDQGYTCSDEGAARARHFHRLCANYADGQHASVEFSGPRTGEIMRVAADPGGAGTAETRAGADRAIELSVPDQESQRRAKSALGAGPAAGQEVTGGWGHAGYDDLTFVVARTWTGPTEARPIGSKSELALLPGRLAEAGYTCAPGAATTCRREANGARWTFTFDVAPAEPPADLSRVTLLGEVVDARTLDPADELATVLPGGLFSQPRRMHWFVRTADQETGQAGFARGVRMDYRVTMSGNSPSRVLIDARTPCRADGAAISC